VHKSKIGIGGVDEKMWQSYFDQLRDGIYSGYGGKGIKLEYGPDWVFNQKLFANAAVFAAFKNHANTHEMIGHLLNADGTLKSFKQFRKDTAGIVGTYNGHWLQAEYQTAIAGTRMANKWKNFERRAELYPNLKYVTQHDARVRPEHQTLDGIIQPIKNEFWKKHYPPNGWRCRCDVIQTDAAPTDDDTKGFVPDKPFEGNVGLDEAIFPETHPYFDELKATKVKIERQAEEYFAKTTRNEVREWGKENLTNGKFLREKSEMPLPISFNNSEIKSITGKAHRNRPMRNELLYVLSDVWKDLVYIGSTTSKEGKHIDVKMWYYYDLILDGERFVFNFQQINADGQERIGLYAITDNVDYKTD
jgi:SPP1 gp7 family putative phage head morphogenesis protein